MEYKKIGNTYAIRMDRDDEIIEKLTEFIVKEDVKLGQVSAIGAINSFTIGAYSVAEQKYYSKDYEGTWEIVSLLGNITRKEGEPYIHLHLSAGGHNGEMVGGHLNRAVISATCEMFVTCYEGTIERIRNPEVGLNIFKFEES